MPRLFLALWPDAAAARALGDLARALARRTGGKPVPPSRIHLTLVFLGEVAEGTIAAASAKVEASAFRVTLDCVGAFGGARVAWAGSRVAAPGLVTLQARLAEELRARGFRLEEREFAPHLTLVRNIVAPLPNEPIEAIGWEAREFALVRTEPGRYATLDTCALTA